jgi:uncharacterized surface protein with fasciclin (FAS1) repeats
MMQRTFLAVLWLAACLPNPNAVAQEKTIVQTAVDAGNFTTLVAAVKAAGLVDTLGGHNEFTVFAPTDEAFAKVAPDTLQSLLQPENRDQLTSILTYHVLPGRVSARDAYGLNDADAVNGQRLHLDLRGDVPRVNESRIVITDIPCSNGVIHVIDTVLMPALSSIPSTAEAAGQFNTLLAAVDAAGLGEVLGGPGPFTIFAPTDDAFAALPEGTVESLLKTENRQQLIDILKFHVISGRVYDTDAVSTGFADSLLGRSLEIGFSADGIRVNGSRVLARNIAASNGVIHVIDSVLLPTSMSRHEVMATLTNAVERGAAAFNAGHHDRCSEIYMDAMRSIMTAGIQHADPVTMDLVRQTVEQARNTHSMTDRAWVLRRGIDSLYSRVSQMSTVPGDSAQMQR